MNTRYLISLLCAGALAFACGPRSRTEPGTVATANATSTTTHPTAAPKHAVTAKGPKLDSRLKVDVAQGEVRFAFDVANVGKKHMELSFPSGKSYDFVVVDSTGREVWHWSSGRMFTQGVQNKQLGTGDSLKVAESWEKLPSSGVYTAIATLNSTNYPVEQRVDFVVP
ncbi:MAG TPA: BsuPI-related putative proteinase inhibitor [Gemmatimonadaceae bacterium]